jgi:hypothetical protein
VVITGRKMPVFQALLIHNVLKINVSLAGEKWRASRTRAASDSENMTLLPVLYWIVLILSIIGVFAPPTWAYGRYVSGFSATVLFIIIGLRIFRIPIQ